MFRRPLVHMVAVAAIAVPVTTAPAQEPATKRATIEHAAEICANGRDAMARHVRRARQAARDGMWNAFARHGRRYARVGLRHVRRLNRLPAPPPGRYWYDRYVDRARSTLKWVNLAMDGYAERRFRVATRRLRRAARHRSRAEKAAREYGLRGVCVQLLEA